MIVALYDRCKTFSSERRAPLKAGLVSMMLKKMTLAQGGRPTR
jgi:hypothetical protein